ncbi:molybdate ABC transporter substrate-binding protein [Alteromonas sp. D210916BOD_24]|uniref:molybdate ABC transporter substrate-binding protein n=1 Tax=Alteromonas sp. D210916BOD_24 TaxID=3157618 RepID=UPI00399C6122
MDAKTLINSRGLLSILLGFSLIGLSCSVNAVQQIETPPIHVAVAANFAKPLKIIAHRFTQLTGVEVSITVSSSGTLYAQIQHGAKFDVFLSADTKRPQALVDNAIVHKDNLRDYAKGQLALVYSPSISDLPDQFEALTQKEQQAVIVKVIRASVKAGKLALANPMLAPYGVAAENTLHALNLWEEVAQSKVMGKNVLQTYQFFSTGSASAALVAYSLVAGQQHSHHVIVIPEALHQPIIQSLIINSKASAQLQPNLFDAASDISAINQASIPASHLFVQYLLSNTVQQSLEKWGYHAVSSPHSAGQEP